MTAPRLSTLRRLALALTPLLVIGCAQAGSETSERAPAPTGKDDPMSAAQLEKIPASQPGAEPFGEELRLRLAEALSGRGEDYAARTRHLGEDGSPLYTNRLLLETSPYLHQHAHNPVNWYPWGEEAFEAARRLGRPILLSIGYSTCHWCHVMEEESFEDVEIATFMNEHYIAVKVDREVRPDVDAIYMQAVQLLSRGGGWPLNVWLTPEGEPFYGGTYFPPRDGDRGARAGFLTILREISRIYREEPEKVAQTTGPLTRAVRTSLAGLAPDPDAGMPGPEVLREAASFYRGRFDGAQGGLRGAPKFPSTLPVRFLLRYHRRSGDEQALEMAALSLEKMARGGMYDQLGGGFHRYSVDERWLVPHFEKMLYDNALLTVAYVEGWQATGREDFAGTARDILRYVSREMTSPEGAFYSATDADSLNPEGHREEGWFFTWTPAEMEAVVDREKVDPLLAYYGVSEGGNFEGRNIFNLRRPLEAVAKEMGMKPAALTELLEETREPLYQARALRPPPLRDDKILAAWNGLMISAYARAGLAFGEPELTRAGARAADFILEKMRREGRLYRSFREGRPEHPAFVEDYAFLIAGLLDLYEAEADPRRLSEAVTLQEVLDRHYLDEKAGGYFTTADDHEKLLAREKPGYDGAEPTGNSVAALNLLRLHEFTGRDEYRKRADHTLAAFSATLRQSPAALSEMLLALDFRLDTPKEIVLVKPSPSADVSAMKAVLAGSFVPNRVLSVVAQGEELESQSALLPLLEGRIARKGKVTAYVCENRICRLPTTDPEELRRQIGTVRPLFEPAPGEGEGPASN